MFFMGFLCYRFRYGSSERGCQPRGHLAHASVFLRSWWIIPEPFWFLIYLYDIKLSQKHRKPFNTRWGIKIVSICYSIHLFGDIFRKGFSNSERRHFAIVWQMTPSLFFFFALNQRLCLTMISQYVYFFTNWL